MKSFTLSSIHGAKGGKGGGEAPNTLRSNARVRVVELLSEGEIVGLVDGNRSIYFDYTPLQNPDGTYNFGALTPEQKEVLEQNGYETPTSGSTTGTEGTGISWTLRTGLPDQEHIPGVPTAETPFAVETRVKHSTGPVVRTISEADADSVRVIIRIPALGQQDKENGALVPASVSYAIELRPNGGAWTRVVTQAINNQKCTSPFLQAHRIQLPINGFPWQLRVVRLTPDPDTVDIQNETWWESYTTIVEGKFTYPDSALIHMEVSAREFGSSLPTRTYHVKGIKIMVPSNYDPETRTYTGIWDGTFVKAWSNNPAWIFYDLLTNPRYGLGDFIDEAKVDKWGLYTIARYCDELVPSGFKNPVTGADIMEPRFTFNGVINNREEAHKVLNNISRAFRGMAYWSLGQVFAVADMPSDPVRIVAPANVLKGHFQYSGSALKARHSVSLVSWNDPDDFCRPAVEVVQNDEMIAKFGWREKEEQLTGCQSRGMAHRFGKWVLDTEQHETEMVEYECSFDQADLLPGQLILVADPRKNGTRTGGRVVSVSGSTVVIDAPFVPEVGESYTFFATKTDGTLHSVGITSINAGAGHKELITASPLPADVVPGSMWAIMGTDVQPRRYRVMSNTETAPNTFRITAMFHDPTKFDRVEQDIVLDPIRYARPRNSVAPVTNITATESLYFQSNVARTRINVSWSPPTDVIVKEYQVSANTPDGFINFGAVTNASLDIDDTKAGAYKFFVAATNNTGLTSPYTEFAFTATGWEGLAGPYVSHLEIVGRGNTTIFGGRDVKFAWRNNFPQATYETGSEPNGAGTNETNPLFRDNVVRVFHPTTGQLLRQTVCETREFLYTYEMNTVDNAVYSRAPSRKLRVEVSVRDTLGRESDPQIIIVENPVPSLIIPTLKSGIEQIFVEIAATSDIDQAGYTVWAEKDPTFNPKTTTPKYDGPNNQVAIKADMFETYYVRVGAYDSFGRTGMNISPPIEITVGGIELDSTPPAIPTGLAVTSSLVRLATGDVQAKIVADWDDSPSLNFGTFQVEIRPTGGNFISFSTGGSRYEWTGLTMNQEYEIRVRSVSQLGVPSTYCTSAFVFTPQNTTAPNAPTGLTADASLKSVYLKWNNPIDTDIDLIEIWSHTSDVRASATMIGSSKGTSFTHAGLTTGQQRFYWVRAKNTSGVTGSFNATAGVAVTPGQISTSDLGDATVVTTKIAPLAVTTTTIADEAITSAKIVANAIVADKIAANAIVADKIATNAVTSDKITANAIITSKIAANAIVADKILAGTITGDKLDINTSLPATITVGLTGVQIGTIESRAADPGARINAYTTQIDPGKILISGATTLASWRNGLDQTKIEGGLIAANSVSANKLQVGLRGLDIVGIEFSFNKTTNVLSWTSGTIIYTDDLGATAAASISSGSVTWTTGVVYVAWQKAATSLTTTTSIGGVTGSDWVRLATYTGGMGLVANYGRTLVDGDQIITGTITASKLSVTSLSSIVADLGTVTAGVVKSSDDKFKIDLNNKYFEIWD